MRILDTDVCIEILRHNGRVISRRRATLDHVATTWITAAELYYGAAKSRTPQQKAEAVTEFLSTLPGLGLNERSAQRFGNIKADLEQIGQGLADADLLIGAICLAHNAILATGNLRHYERIKGLTIEDWIRGYVLYNFYFFNLQKSLQAPLRLTLEDISRRPYKNLADLEHFLAALVQGGAQINAEC
ncbi:MAG TPA: type II toxin-antitoxin system VapC family toxin [Methylomirabilota bacterium]|nr:type II toxin-antitoxin system VapC family toxin [Methylomirabilota bacterium]